jgi:hypothetical protein
VVGCTAVAVVMVAIVALLRGRSEMQQSGYSSMASTIVNSGLQQIQHSYHKPWLDPVVPVNLQSIVATEPKPSAYTPSLSRSTSANGMDDRTSITTSTNVVVTSKPVDKLIPRNIWLGFKKVPSDDAMSSNLKALVSKAALDGWTVHMLGHHQQLQFMETFYPNTSILWAFKNIHSGAGPSACDIWRYSGSVIVPVPLMKITATDHKGLSTIHHYTFMHVKTIYMI